MQARVLRRTPLYAAIVIGAVVVADIARLGVTTYRYHAAPGNTSVARSAPPRLPRGNDIAGIVTGHLFGNTPAPVVQGELRNAPDAGGAFLLSGVIASHDPKVGYAIMGRKGQVTRLFSAGGLLTGLGSGRLYEVYEDRVVLDLGGRFETLRLPHLAGGPGSVAQTANSDDSAPIQIANTAVPVKVDQPLTPARMFRNLNPVPKFARGHFGGMRLMPSEDDEQKFGLRNGDLVVAVNGVPLTSAGAVNGLLTNQGSQHSTISLTVLRDGAQQVIAVTNGN